MTFRTRCAVRAAQHCPTKAPSRTEHFTTDVLSGAPLQRCLCDPLPSSALAAEVKTPLFDVQRQVCSMHAIHLPRKRPMLRRRHSFGCPDAALLLTSRCEQEFQSTC